MAFFDILKKKKTTTHPPHPPAERAPVEGKKEIKPEVKKVVKKPKEVISEVKPTKVKEKRISLAWKVLKSPHITEKATSLVSKNQYVFNVWPRSNKPEIKKAVEGIYGVDVLNVKIIDIPSKKRRLGRTSGLKKGYKKAIVKLKKGQKIEVLPR